MNRKDITRSKYDEMSEMAERIDYLNYKAQHDIMDKAAWESFTGTPWTGSTLPSVDEIMNNNWKEELKKLVDKYGTASYLVSEENHPVKEEELAMAKVVEYVSKQISEADQRDRDVAFEVSDKYIKQLKEVYKKRISEARRQGYDEGFNLARKINQDNRGNHSKASSDIDHTNCPKNGIALRCDHTSSNMPEMRCTGCGNCLSGSAPTGDVCVKILDCKCHKAISKSSYMPACCEECKCTGESMEVPDGLVSVACTWHNGDCHNEKCKCHQDN